MMIYDAAPSARVGYFDRYWMSTNAALTHDNFENFYLSTGMLETLQAVEYQAPTPVQAATIPLVMAGIDLIVQSQTGTGKTAAFAIPITEMLSHNPGTIEVLVLAPTRELAKQVSDEFARFCKFKDVEVATVYGGTGYEQQRKALKTAQVVVATPGRLLDLAKQGDADLSNLRIFGLDEADEMLSMGFAEEVDAIIALLPEERQSLLFSATITEDVKALGRSMLYYPEFVTLSSDSVAAEEVSHQFFRVSGVGRLRDLLKVLEHEEPENAIVFANTKGDTFAVTRFLKRHGLRAEVLNGDLPQKERERTLRLLREGKIDFLVATDVAARGIDISDLSHVINYVIPESAEVYVHRSGRTGRAGAQGVALSLISPREMATLFNVRKLYGIDMIERPLPTPADIVEAKRRRRITAIDEQLKSADLPYGGSLGLARELVDSSSNDSDALRTIARLIALAQRVSQGGLDDVDLRAKVESAAPADRKETVEAQDAEAQSAVEIEENVEVEIEVEAEAGEAAEDKPRRSRRGRSNGRTQAKSEDAKSADAKSNEDKERPRRRRRRREERSEDDGQKAKSKRAKSSDDGKAADADKESDKSDGSQSRRRSRRGRSRDDDRGDTPRRSRRERRSRDRDDKPAPKKAPEPTPMSKIWVSVGRDQFAAAEEVVEMVCFMAGMDPEDLGSVTLENSYSYVEVREDYFYDIISAMNDQDWNGITVSAEPARK